jgi:putative ABC transport system permease protein
MARKSSMKLDEAVRIATANLWAHKMRTVLTLLGVVIGVTAVIAVVSLVNGLNRYVAEKVFNLGADVFLVDRAPLPITNIDQWEESQKRRKFYFDDYEALRDACRSCAAVGASLTRVGDAKYGANDMADADVVGFTHEMPEINARELAQGRNFTRLDVMRASPVCFPGSIRSARNSGSTRPSAKSSASARNADR